LNCIAKADITELRSFNNPPVGIFKVCVAAVMLLGYTDTTWANVRKVLNLPNFISMLKDFRGADWTGRE
jgi:hypothetical protein